MKSAQIILMIKRDRMRPSRKKRKKKNMLISVCLSQLWRPSPHNCPLECAPCKLPRMSLLTSTVGNSAPWQRLPLECCTVILAPQRPTCRSQLPKTNRSLVKWDLKCAGRCFCTNRMLLVDVCGNINSSHSLFDCKAQIPACSNFKYDAGLLSLW